MGIKLKQVSATAGRTPLASEDQRRGRKPRYTVSNLPFPTGSSIYPTIWRKNYVPSLISWAGSLGDPFGTNCHMADQVIELWGQIFPSLPALKKDTPNHIIVLAVVRRLLLYFYPD